MPASRPPWQVLQDFRISYAPQKSFSDQSEGDFSYPVAPKISADYFKYGIKCLFLIFIFNSYHKRDENEPNVRGRRMAIDRLYSEGI